MAEQDRRRDPAEAIADGEPVDWNAATPAAPESEDLSGYRLVAEVAEAMRGLTGASGEPPSSPDRADPKVAPEIGSHHWGSLELRERLGGGGFGTVYRAFDPALDREVALKLYHGDATDSRSLDEARRLARVRHPNVLTVHGVAVHDGRAGLWADLVRGKSLAERVESDGPLGPVETTTIGADLCRALAAIHGAGLVHGDLKPSNVMREVGGRIVLMDFGAAQERTGDSDEPVSGTPVVSAPEVLRGEAPSPAADLYSLGVLLYYLVTGKYPLPARSARSVREAHRSGSSIPLSDARPDLPPALVETIERALEPDSGRRFGSAGAMERALLRSVPISTPASAAARPHRRTALASLVVLAFTASALLLWTRRSPDDARAIRASVTVPPEAPVAVKPFPSALAPGVALSPDGRRIGYVARTADGTVIRVRDLADGETVTVPGTEGAYQLSFSPDGNQVLFPRGNELARAPVHGGGAVRLADAALVLGAAWSRSGMIYYVPSPGSGVHAVPAEGGAVRPVSTPDPETEEGHLLPEVLPGGEAILYASLGRVDAGGATRIIGQSLATGERTVLVEGGTAPRYDPGGDLLYASGREVFAIGLDPEGLTVSGPVRSVVSGLLVDPSLGLAPFDVSDSGTLTWVAGAVGGNETSLTWIGRDGETLGNLPAEPRTYLHPRLSPDGRRVVVESRGRTDDLWLYDLERSTLTRLTFEGDNLAPTWGPDGRRLAFSRHTLGAPNLHRMRVDGSGGIERLTRSDRVQIPGSWSPNGRMLAFTETHPETGEDLWLLRLDKEPAADPFLRTPFDESDPAISPSGDWVAYTSDETGRPEVYLRSLSDPPVKHQVTVAGGSRPVWAPAGDELFVRRGDRFLAVAVGPGSAPLAGPPRELFRRRLERSELGPNYDVAADGRILAIQATDAVEPPEALQLLLHWRDVLPDER